MRSIRPVTFTYRDYRHASQRKDLTLSALGFIRRFSLHNLESSRSPRSPQSEITLWAAETYSTRGYVGQCLEETKACKLNN